jgi:hypothetical protein
VEIAKGSSSRITAGQNEFTSRMCSDQCPFVES